MRFHSRRTLLPIVVLAFVVISLAVMGCGDSGSDSQPDDGLGTGMPQVLLFTKQG